MLAWQERLRRRRPDEDDALALMLLQHTHRIGLTEPILDDRTDVKELAAIAAPLQFLLTVASVPSIELPKPG
jgi:hypothetical protein